MAAVRLSEDADLLQQLKKARDQHAAVLAELKDDPVGFDALSLIRNMCATIECADALIIKMEERLADRVNPRDR